MVTVSMSKWEFDRLEVLLGVLRKHVISLEDSTAARSAAITDGTKQVRFKEFHDGAASWDRLSA